MTTETTTTETPKSKIEMANDFVKENDSSTIAQRIVDLDVKAQVAIDANQRIIDERDQYRRKHNELISKITEFIKEHVTEDEIDIDDLKELADELNIALTKEVEISFMVTYTATATVPLDFDTDNIDETDFDVDVTYNGNSDYDVEETNCDIEDFDISDDN